MCEDASQPVVVLGPMETDEQREGAFLLSAISCSRGLTLLSFQTQYIGVNSPLLSLQQVTLKSENFVKLCRWVCESVFFD